MSGCSGVKCTPSGESGKKYKTRDKIGGVNMADQQEFDDELKGVLFVVDNPVSDRHPDYNGQAQIDGKEYWVSGWENESRDGVVFVRLSFREKDETREEYERQQRASSKRRKPALRRRRAAAAKGASDDAEDGSDHPF